MIYYSLVAQRQSTIPKIADVVSRSTERAKYKLCVFSLKEKRLSLKQIIRWQNSEGAPRKKLL